MAAARGPAGLLRLMLEKRHMPPCVTHGAARRMDVRLAGDWDVFLTENDMG
jgi:hypothetical protein